MKTVFVTIARNIVNQSMLDQFIQTKQFLTINPRVAKFIASTLRNYLIEHGKATAHKLKKSDPDWAVKAIERGDKLFNLDFDKTILETVIRVETSVQEQGRQQLRKKQDLKIKEDLNDAVFLMVSYLNKKPEHCNLSVLDVFNRANIWMYKEREKASSNEGKIRIIRQYKSGYAWVDLLDDQALIREGKLMKHCVGDEVQTYRKGVQDGSLKIISLRDQNNIPHCTIELQVREHKIQQIKGSANSAIKPEYVKYIKDFLEKPIEGLDFQKVEDLMSIGLVQDSQGRYLALRNLPEGTVIPDTLTINDISVKKLPNNLTILGSLVIYKSSMTNLPEGLNVQGDLAVSGFKRLKAVPSDLKAINVDLSDSGIESLPQNFKVRGSLNVSGTDIATLPEGLRVGGSLMAERMKNLKKLPTKFKVGVGISLTNSAIQVLPDNLKVNGSLNINGTQIKNLPKGLKIRYMLDIRDTAIDSVPDDLIVNNIIGGPPMLRINYLESRKKEKAKAKA